MINSKITKHDLLVLSIMTDYLFCNNFKEVLGYCSSLLEEPVDYSNFHSREIQAKLKGQLWPDFLVVKKKLGEQAK